MSGVTVSGPITQKYSTDVYGTHYSKKGIGGAQTGFASLNEVYLIPVERREALMIVSVRNYGGSPALFWLETVSTDPLILADNNLWTLIPIGANLGGGVTYKGNFSAITGLIDGGTTPILDPPTLSPSNAVNGDFYVCSAAGTIDFGQGNQTFNLLDYAVFDGARWRLLPGGSVASWATLSGRPQILVDIGDGTFIPADQVDLTAIDVRVTALEAAQLTSTDVVAIPSALVTTETAVLNYAYSKPEVDNLILGAIGSGAIEAKSHITTWGAGVPGGGDTYVDFVIPGVVEDGEIGGVSSSILFIAGALQTTTFTIATTTWVNDTLRVNLPSTSEPSGSVVAFYYNRSGLSFPFPFPASSVAYSNTVSGLTAVDVQAAVDELVVMLDAQNEASEISYDNVGSGLVATNVQGAIDELYHDYIREIHVDLDNGNDLNAGDIDTPLLTIEQAWTKRVAIGPTIRVIIFVHGTNQFPSSLTLDGGGSLSDDCATYVIGDAAPAGRWEYGPQNIILKNSGFVYFGGVAFYGGLQLQSDIHKAYASFANMWIIGSYAAGSLTVLGTPNKDNGIYLTGGARWFVYSNMSGNLTKTQIYAHSSFIQGNYNITASKIDLHDASINMNSGRILTITGTSNMYGASKIVLNGTASFAGAGTMNNYGGEISKSASATVTATISNQSRTWSKHHYFESGASGIVATNVEDAVKEVKGLITTTAAVGHLYVHKLGNDTTGAGTIGAPFLTIQKAIDTANEGDVIHVGEGQFTEAITFKLNVVIQGETSKSYTNNNGGTQVAPVTCVMDQTLADGDTGLEVTLRNVYFLATMTKTGPNFGVHVRVEHCYYDDISTLTGVISSVDARDTVFNGTANSIICYGCQTVFVAGGVVTLSDCYQTVNFTATTISSTANMELNNCYLKGNVTVGGNLTQDNTVLTGTVGVTGTHTIFGQPAIGSPYDNATSGLAATNVQGAIDEMVAAGFGPAVNSWYVATTGNDTTGSGAPSDPVLTIAEAISRASAGDLIYVGPGTFAGAFTINKHLSIIGTAGGGKAGFYSNRTYITGNITVDTTAASVNVTLRNFQHQSGTFDKTGTNKSYVEAWQCRFDSTYFRGTRLHASSCIFATAGGDCTWDEVVDMSDCLVTADAYSWTAVTYFHAYESYFQDPVSCTGQVRLHNCTMDSSVTGSAVIQKNTVIKGTITGTHTKDNQHASTLPYSNITSGLTATIVQDAIDELDANKLEVPNYGTLTIKTLDASGKAAAGSNRLLAIAANSGTADDMVELTGLTVGDKVLLVADAGDTITVKHNDAGATVKIVTLNSSDFVLDTDHPTEFVLTTSTTLVEIKQPAQKDGSFYFSTPAATTLSAATPAKAAGTTTAVTEKGITHSTNRLTIVGGEPASDYIITATISVTKATGGSTLGSFYIAKGGTVIAASKINRSLANTSDEGSVALQAIVSMAGGDYVEVWVETNNGDNLTVESGNLIVRSL